MIANIHLLVIVFPRLQTSDTTIEHAELIPDVAEDADAIPDDRDGQKLSE
jgi:hypothetical protein